MCYPFNGMHTSDPPTRTIAMFRPPAADLDDEDVDSGDAPLFGGSSAYGQPAGTDPRPTWSGTQTVQPASWPPAAPVSPPFVPPRSNHTGSTALPPAPAASSHVDDDPRYETPVKVSRPLSWYLGEWIDWSAQAMGVYATRNVNGVGVQARLWYEKPVTVDEFVYDLQPGVWYLRRVQLRHDGRKRGSDHLYSINIPNDLYLQACQKLGREPNMSHNFGRPVAGAVPQPEPQQQPTIDGRGVDASTMMFIQFMSQQQAAAQQQAAQQQAMMMAIMQQQAESQRANNEMMLRMMQVQQAPRPDDSRSDRLVELVVKDALETRRNPVPLAAAPVQVSEDDAFDRGITRTLNAAHKVRDLVAAFTPDAPETVANPVAAQTTMQVVTSIVDKIIEHGDKVAPVLSAAGNMVGGLFRGIRGTSKGGSDEPATTAAAPAPAKGNAWVSAPRPAIRTKAEVDADMAEAAEPAARPVESVRPRAAAPAQPRGVIQMPRNQTPAEAAS